MRLKHFHRSALRLDLAKTILSKTGVAVFGALTAILISSGAGKELLGVYAAVRLIPVFFVLLADFGYSTSYSYKINSQKVSAEIVLQNGIVWLACVFLLHLAAVAIFLSVRALGFLADHSIAAGVMLALVSFFYAALLHGMNFFRATKKLGIANRIFSILEFFILSSVFFASQILKKNFTEVFFIQILLLAHFLVFLKILFDVNQLKYKLNLTFSAEVIFSSLRYGLRTQFSSAAQLIYYRIDQMIVGFYLGAGDLGLYFIASKSAEIFRILVVTIVFVYEPLLARLKSDDAVAVVKKTYWKLIFINSFVVLSGILAVPYLIPFFFGEWAASAIIPTIIIIMGLIFSGASGLINAYNCSIGRPDLNNFVIFCSLLIMVILNFTLIPLWGILGAATSAATTQVVSALGYRLVFNRFVHKTFT